MVFAYRAMVYNGTIIVIIKSNRHSGFIPPVRTTPINRIITPVPMTDTLDLECIIKRGRCVRKMLQKLFSFPRKTKTQRPLKKRKSTGQSLVEFALLLPILLMLFSGMIEFGFMLNSYLSLLDSTRQAARLFANSTPFRLDTATNTIVDDPNFSPSVALAVVDILAPAADPNARQIVMDTTRDDVLVSVLRVNVDDNTQTISSIERFPEGSLFYSLYANQMSAYEDLDIENFMIQNGTTPVETGILIVEVYYGYKGILKLPWIEPFMNDDAPVLLHASTIMPLVAAKP